MKRTDDDRGSNNKRRRCDQQIERVQNFLFTFNNIIQNQIINSTLNTMEIAKIKPTSYVYNKKQMIGKGSFG